MQWTPQIDNTNNGNGFDGSEPVLYTTVVEASVVNQPLLNEPDTFAEDSPTPLEPLPNIPAKRYFTIGEVSALCGVKAHVLRYWEQEFTQLSPVKRAGNRRYYQRHEVMLVRRIRELLYEQGLSISNARLYLQEHKVRQEENVANEQQAQQHLKNLVLSLKQVLAQLD